MKPTDEQAFQFAVMLQAGLPAQEAILYFVDTQDPSELAMLLRVWTRSVAVKKAMALLMKKPWQEMSLEERMKCALDQHYNSLAYLLWSQNYIEASTTDKGKLDTARAAIEAKIAGTAGKMSELDRFFADVRSGSVILAGKAKLGSTN